MAQKKITKTAAAADRSDDEPEIPEAEKAAVRRLLGQIERAKVLTKTFNETVLPQLRRLNWGSIVGSEGDTQTIRTNLIFATQATLLPHTYAKNPEISVAPTEAVGPNEYQKIKDFCKTAQVALNNMFVDEAKLKRRVKANIRSVMTTSVGWLKLSYQESLKSSDALILHRANDLQDNLSRIEHLIMASKRETNDENLNRQREELKQQYQALMQRPEIRIFKGFVIDRVKTEDVFILDESIREFDDYVHAKKLAHRVWMTDDDYHERYGKAVEKSAVSFGQPAAGDVIDEGGAKVEFSASGKDIKQSYRAVYEVWDHVTNTVCEVCEGCHGYARAPRIMEPTPERWYPLYALGFNLVEGRWRPLSDVELLRKLQDEYNTTRYLYAEARKEAIPTRVFRKGGGLTPEDIQNLSNRTARQFIGIEGNPAVPLDKDILQLPGIAIDPAAYDVTVIRNDMDMLVGLSDASRSNLIQAKTATEAEIMRQSLMTRVAERQDAVEDMVSEMALSCLEMMLQRFTKAEIQQIVGEGASWPEEPDLEDIFRKIRVSVKAGTSGKPNLMKERESWAQVVPIINETMTQVAELRAAGQMDLAEAKIELLKETFARYDEKIDVDRFVPRAGGANGQAAMMQQFMELQQKFVQVQDEYAKCKEELQVCQQERDAAKRGEQAKIAESETKRAIETARAQSDIQVEADRTTRALDTEIVKHAMTLKSQERIEQMKMGVQMDIAEDDNVTELLKAGEQVRVQAETARANARVQANAKAGKTKAAASGGGSSAGSGDDTPEVASLLKQFEAKLEKLAKPEPMVVMGPDGLPDKVRTPAGDMVVKLDENGLPADLVPEGAV